MEVYECGIGEASKILRCAPLFIRKLVGQGRLTARMSASQNGELTRLILDKEQVKDYGRANPRKSRMDLTEAKVAKASTYTTGQLALNFDVAPRTVSKWVDAGTMKGYRIPGSSDRRVTHRALEDFVAENGLPLCLIPGYKADVLLVTGDDRLREMLQAALFDGTQLVSVNHWYSFGVRFGSGGWAAVVLDFAMGMSDSSRVIGEMSTRPSRPPIYGLLPEGEMPLDIMGVRWFQYPFDAEAVEDMARRIDADTR